MSNEQSKVENCEKYFGIYGVCKNIDVSIFQID